MSLVFSSLFIFLVYVPQKSIILFFKKWAPQFFSNLLPSRYVMCIPANQTAGCKLPAFQIPQMIHKVSAEM